jgi:hypothetical protein
MFMKFMARFKCSKRNKTVPWVFLNVMQKHTWRVLSDFHQVNTFTELLNDSYKKRENLSIPEFCLHETQSCGVRMVLTSSLETLYNGQVCYSVPVKVRGAAISQKLSIDSEAEDTRYKKVIVG